jgi:hypothetical protein
MPTELSGDLIFIALCVAALCLALAKADLPFFPALAIVTIRIGLPFAYFAWFNDGTWSAKDDKTYFDLAEDFVSRGFTPFGVFFEPQGITTMMAIANNSAFFYYWWNFMSQYFFGVHYYSPVFLNVMVTFAAGWVAFRLLARLGFSKRYRQCFLGFFLLHWDVVAWSSFMNLKDVLMMGLTVSSIYLLISMYQEFRLVKLGLMALNVFVFSWLRFYIPFLIIGVFLLWSLFRWKDRRKYFILPPGMAAAFFLFPWRPETFLKYVQPGAFLDGLIRFPMTPQPWSVEKAYSFLYVPAVMHWVLFIPAIIGAVQLWRLSPLNSMPLMYLAAIILFYALVPEVLGPRHRVQTVFIFAWMQFHFFWLAAARFASPGRAEPAPSIAAAPA